MSDRILTEGRSLFSHCTPDHRGINGRIQHRLALQTCNGANVHRWLTKRTDESFNPDAEKEKETKVNPEVMSAMCY